MDFAGRGIWVRVLVACLLFRFCLLLVVFVLIVVFSCGLVCLKHLLHGMQNLTNLSKRKTFKSNCKNVFEL